jgi:hypothetical protein
MVRQLVFILLALTAVTSRAELAWSARELQLAINAGTAEIATAFPFRNSGQEPVTFIGLRTDCGCTEAETEKTTYSPGESGRVEVRFHPGERLGMHEKTIEARTSDGTITRLKLHVVIADPLSLSASVLRWPVGSAANEQVVAVNATGPHDITELAIDGPDAAAFAIQTTMLGVGRRYEMSVRPHDSSAAATKQISIRARFADGDERHLSLQLVIK